MTARYFYRPSTNNKGKPDESRGREATHPCPLRDADSKTPRRTSKVVRAEEEIAMKNSPSVVMGVLIPAFVLMFAAGTLWAQDPVNIRTKAGDRKSTRLN